MDSSLEMGSRPSPSPPLLGFWYPALAASQVRPGHMQAQTLLGLPLVLCRNRQGEPFALRDICPHRGIPLSFGHFDGDRLERCYHGWQFDMSGRCRHIPALSEGDALQREKIGVATSACREQDGHLWGYVPDGNEKNAAVPEVPTLPRYSDQYRFLHISTMLQCTLDDGIVGLMDPAHGPFVHQSW